MTTMYDLGPAAQEMVTLLEGISDDQLPARTPCEQSTLGDLIDHVSMLSLAFTGAANKELSGAASQPPAADATRLGPEWRTRIPQELWVLVDAWRNPDAWEGMTRAGGIDLPSEMAGKIALNELVIHGWDIARASDQPFDVDARSLDASWEFVSMMSAPEEQAGREGLFGPVVEVAADASELDRVIGLSGRDPRWPVA